MILPARWLATYESRWLVPDLVAGVTLAAYAVPVALAYAELAGLPPQVGVYGYLLGGVGYALFGSSRQLAIGPTSAISLLVGAGVAPLAGGDPGRMAQIAALSALCVGALCLVAWALRLSTLTSFISETILLGFKAGAGLSIAATQLPNLLGVAGGGEHFFARLLAVAQQIGEVNPVTLTLGAGALVLLLLGERFLPGRPVALLVVIGAIVVVSTWSLGAHGVATAGALPAGLPGLGLPGIRVRDVDGVLPLAAACLLLAYIESVSAARTFAVKHDDPLDVRQELLGLGAANLAVALGHGYPVAGGLSQSAVNEQAGARSPLALLVASLTLALCLQFLTTFVRDLPKAVLAAIVLLAVKGLIDLGAIVRLRRVTRLEFRVAMVALVGVLFLGILKGVLLAAVASILLLLARAATPYVAILGRIPHTNRYSDLDRNPDNERVPGVLICRCEASLLYFNAEGVLHEVLRHAATEPEVALVVLDLSTSPYVDLAGARMLKQLHARLERQGIALRLAETRAAVRDILRAEGLEEKVGHVSRRTAIADVVDDFARAGGRNRPAGPG